MSAQAARLTNPEEATSQARLGHTADVLRCHSAGLQVGLCVQIPVTSERPDVSNATVQTTFRFTPYDAEKAESADNRTHANILFVGESNTSRSILAQGIFTSMVAEAGLSDSLQCESKVNLPGKCYPSSGLQASGVEQFAFPAINHAWLWYQ